MDIRDHLGSTLRSMRSAALATMFAAMMPAGPAAADFGQPFEVARLSETAEVHFPRVFTDNEGNALFLWHLYEDGNRIEARVRTAAGAFGQVLTLNSGVPGLYANPPRIAMNGNGHTLIVWNENGNLEDGVIWARTYSPASGFGSVLRISRPRDDPFSADVAIDPDGNALVVWSGCRYDEPCAVARSYSVANGFGPIQTLSDAAVRQNSPQVAMSPKGDGLVIWEQGSSIWGRAYSVDGGFGPIEPILIDHKKGANFRKVALDDNGNALIVWNRFRAGKVEARTRSAAGDLGKIRVLSDAKRRGSQARDECRR